MTHTTLPDSLHDLDPAPDVDRAAMRDAMGAFPSGVTVVTTAVAGRPAGVTVSAFASASLDPPLALACIAKSSATLAALTPGAPAAVNVLARDQSWLAERFAGRTPDRFAGVDWAPDRWDSPLLAGAAAWVSGYVWQLHDAGDHLVVLVRVNELTRFEHAPLLYHSGTFHDWSGPGAGVQT